jgi:hypothetical protein
MAQASQPTGYQHEDAWDSSWLRVDDVHELYYQQYGKKDGKPGTMEFPSKKITPPHMSLPKLTLDPQ